MADKVKELCHDGDMTTSEATPSQAAGRIVTPEERSARHEPTDAGEFGTVCNFCNEPWPCDARVFLGTVEQQGNQIAAVLELHADQDGQCGWCWEDTDGYDPIFAAYPCPTDRALGVSLDDPAEPEQVDGHFNCCKDAPVGRCGVCGEDWPCPSAQRREA